MRPATAALLQSLVEPAKENLDVALHIHVKQKGQDGSEQVAALLDGVRASGDPCVLGVLSKASHISSPLQTLSVLKISTF